MAASSYKKNII